MRSRLRLFVPLSFVLLAGCGKHHGRGAPTPTPTPPPGGAPVRGFGTSAGVVADRGHAPIAIAMDASSLYAAGAGVEKRSLSDGSPVAGFGTDGYVAGNAAVFFQAIAVDATGIYLVGNEVVSQTDIAWHLEKRSLSDGSLVATFGSGGIVREDFGGFAQTHGVAVDSTGIYVVGNDPTGGSEWRIEKRSLADGSLVSGFGTAGVVAETGSVVRGIALHGSSLLLAGYGSAGWRVEERATGDGSLVAGFGSGGAVDVATTEVPFAITTDGTSVWVAGRQDTTARNDYQWRIEKRLLSNGTLDAAFGTAGVVNVDPGGGPDIARSLAVDSGSLYVVGSDTGSGAWRIEKRDAGSGALATGFGASGVVTTSPSTIFGLDQPEAVLVGGGSLYVTGSSPGCTSPSDGRIEKRDAATGALASGFGGDGSVASNDHGAAGLLNAATLNGTTMYLAGATVGGAWHLEARSTVDGAPQSGFGTGGALTVFPVAGALGATAVVHDATFLYIAGYQDTTGDGTTGWRIEKRSLVDGSLDAGFGSGGVVSESVGDGRPTGMVLSGSTLYLVGYDSAGGDREWRIEARATSDGTPVTAFGNQGVIVSNPSPSPDAASAVGTDGTNLFVAGTSRGTWRIEKRLVSDGSLVSGFGSGGVVTTYGVGTPSAIPGHADAIAVAATDVEVVGALDTLGYAEQAVIDVDPTTGAATQADVVDLGEYRAVLLTPSSAYWAGADQNAITSTQWSIASIGGSSSSGAGPGSGITVRALASDGVSLYALGDGFSSASSNGEWRVEKRDLSSLALNAGFGSGGVLEIDPLRDEVRIAGSAISSSSLYLFGTAASGLFWLEKRSLADGSRDATFGAGGAVMSTGLVGPLRASAIAIGSGAVYLAGAEDVTGAGVDWQWHVEKRDAASGALDGGFGSAGVYVSDPSAGDDEASALVLDSAALYVVGYDGVPGASDTRWRVETVDENGSQVALSTSDPSTGDDRATAIAIDADWMYVGGWAGTVSGDRQWRIEKRSLVSNAVDPGFGFDGVLLEDPTAGDDRIAALALDGPSLDVAGFDASPGGGTLAWRLERRSPATGALDASFGDAGVVSSNPWAPADSSLSLVVDGADLFLAGGDRSPGANDSQWRLERRSRADGALDPTFGSGGAVTENVCVLDDVATTIAVDPTAIYVAGTPSTCGGFGTSWRVEKRAR